MKKKNTSIAFFSLELRKNESYKYKINVITYVCMS